MPTGNRMRQMTPASAARIVVRRPRPVNTGGILPAADEMTVGRHLHRLATGGNRHATDATIAGQHLHLALAETTVEVVTGRNRRESPTPAAGRYRRRSDSFSGTPPRLRSRSPATPRERMGPGLGPFL